MNGPGKGEGKGGDDKSLSGPCWGEKKTERIREYHSLERKKISAMKEQSN